MMISMQDRSAEVLKRKGVLLSTDILEWWESGAEFWGLVHSQRSQGAQPTVFSLLAELAAPWTPKN